MGKPTPFGIHEQTTIRRMVADGACVAEIGRALKCPHSKVHYYCKAHGLTPRIGTSGVPSKITAEQASKITEWRAKRVTYDTIARRLGLTRSCVVDFASRSGLSARRQPLGLDDRQIDSVFGLWHDQGLSCGPICLILGCDRKPVMRLIGQWRHKGIHATRKRIAKAA